MSCVAVIPLMLRVCQEIPFSYEVNDDAAIAQILDGSYTGSPDGHAIFIRYPLSFIMKFLYEKNPTVRIGGAEYSDLNWYIGVIVILEILALTAVLFRILNYFTYNRILLCILFDVGFMALWLPCFSKMTFSTAAAFMGCMGLLFFGLERKEEAWRPWNLLLLGIFLASSWCLRKPCFYMVLPFLLIELVLKYHIHFFRSVKPWVVFSFVGVLFAGLVFLNNQMYGSQGWQQYYIYNHERAYLQDYVGFPEYESNEDFYESLGINENASYAMANYTYCLVDAFETSWVEETYEYVKAQEAASENQISEEMTAETQTSGDGISENQSSTGQSSLWKSIKKAVKKARKYLLKKNQTSTELKNASFYFCLLLIPVFLITVLFCWKKKIAESIRNLLRIFSMLAVMAMEWVYLAMNGRFPQRVEETIRLLMFCVGLLLVCKLLWQWRDNPFTHIPVILQIIVLIVFLQAEPFDATITEVVGTQEYNLQYGADKAQVLSYCGERQDSYYILDTTSFGKTSRPSDDMKQGNWILSGSWVAYSPLYEEKLEAIGTESLGSEFLLQDNVYIITKGKKNISKMLGLSGNQTVETEIVDEIMTDNNLIYEVYSVTEIYEVEE
ncbi:MAG: hypothetical protein LUF92_05550 [Clostridiales bacterium]|nr:hypothetical protein [Clostridiales bacterium]